MKELKDGLNCKVKPETVSEKDLKRMKTDPVEMYIHSLRMGSRLPDELHDAMLTHALDPSSSEKVKSYLEWVSTCERRMEREECIKRRESLITWGVFVSILMVTTAHVMLVLEVMKKW